MSLDIFIEATLLLLRIENGPVTLKAILKKIALFVFFLLTLEPNGYTLMTAYKAYQHLKQLFKGLHSSFRLFHNFLSGYRIHTILESRMVDLFQMIKEYQGHSESVFVKCLINGVIQIATIDTLKLLGLPHTIYIGFSFGAILSAYAEGILSLERTVLLLFYSALDLEKANGRNDHEVNFQFYSTCSSHSHSRFLCH